MAECAVGTNSSCYLIKNRLDDNWIMIAEDIKGFELERGYIYKLKVKKIKEIDDFGQLRSAYSLLEVISKDEYQGRSAMAQQQDATSTEYDLIEIVENDDNLDIPVEDLVIQIDRQEQQITGSGGCNNFFGKLIINDDNSIEIGPLGSTRKFCAKKEVNQFEDKYLQLLQNMQTVEVSDDEIIFKASVGTYIIYQEK